MRRIVGVLLIVVFLVVGAFSVLTGTILDGRDPLSSQCARSAPPPQGGPFFESTRVQGYRTFLPLGVVCTYDVDGDEFGPQSVVHQNWPETVAAAVSLGLVATGMVLLVRKPRQRRVTTRASS